MGGVAADTRGSRMAAGKRIHDANNRDSDHKHRGHCRPPAALRSSRRGLLLAFKLGLLEVAGHPPRPPTDGIFDLQMSVADCSCDEFDPMPASRTSLSENVGSGK